MYCTNPSPRAAAASGRAAAPAAIVAAAGQNKALAAPSTTTRSCDCRGTFSLATLATADRAAAKRS